MDYQAQQMIRDLSSKIESLQRELSELTSAFSQLNVAIGSFDRSKYVIDDLKRQLERFELPSGDF